MTTACAADRYDPGTAGFLLVAVHLAGVYLNVPFNVGGVEVPMVTSLVTVPLLLIRNYPRLDRRRVLPLLGLLVVAGLTILFAPSPVQFFGDRLKGLLQFTFSLAAAGALALELSAWPRRQIARLCLAGVVAILAGCLLENYAGLRVVSNAFREAVFPTAQLQFVERDIEVAGFERPRLFTAEPSEVAKFLVLLAFGWVALSQAAYRHAGGVLITLAGLWLVRSPIIVLLLPLQFALMVAGRPAVPSPRILSPGVAAVVLGLGALLAVAGALPFLASRIGLAVSGGDLSSVMRIVTPVLIAWQTLLASPLVGAGISGSEAIVGIVLQSYEATGMGQLALLSLDSGAGNLANEITNSFWLLWINFGLLGGLLVIALLDRWFVAVGARHRWLAFFAVFVFAQTMGAMHGPYFWTYVAFIGVIVAHLDEIGPLRFVEAPVALQRAA
jgi:hypothetical protein